MKQWIRSDLKDHKPYNASEIEYKVKLNANESPFNLPKVVRKNIIKWFEDEENLNLYPDTDCIELKKELSKWYNVNVENIICSVGSDQLIEYICKIFLEPSDVVVVPSPSFSMYSITAKLNKAKIVEVKFNDDLSYNADRIIEACEENDAKILFLCTPNNPTGVTISCSDIEKILDNVDCPVIIDEAYAEFTNETMLPYINKYNNIIVLRTFSKAYGLAGLRIGYGIADKEFIQALEIVKVPYNLGTLSQKIAIEVLRNSEVYKERIEFIKQEREWLFEQLKSIKGLKVYKSEANFIYVESIVNISEYLSSKKILIRELKSSNGLYFSRITVGERKQNEKLIKKLYKVFEK